MEDSSQGQFVSVPVFKVKVAAVMSSSFDVLVGLAPRQRRILGHFLMTSGVFNIGPRGKTL